MSKQQWIKKTAIFGGGLLGVLVLAALVVPMLVDVDGYRPKIEAAANEQIRGKVTLGKLSLSLWGEIDVKVDGVRVADTDGKALLSVKQAYFHLPFLSFLTGSPTLTFRMREPVVQVSKNREGKLNWLALMKNSSEHVSKPPSSSKEFAVPAIVANARLGIELRNARVNYEDAASGLKTQIKDFNVLLKDLSLSRPMHAEIWADLDTKMGKTLTVKGPAKLHAEARPEVSGGKLLQLTVTAKADFDGLAISMPGTFEKRKGVAANADFNVQVNEGEATLQSVVFRFANAVLTATGKVSNLSGQTGPVVQVKVRSNEILLKPWADLVPQLKEYELGGAARLEGDLSGPASKIAYRGRFALEAVTAKAPSLKSQPRIDGYVQVATDQVEDFSLKIKAPGNDLQIRGKLTSFSRPQAQLMVTSSGMDLDQLMDLSKSSGAAKSESADRDVDALLDPLRKNKALRDAAFTVLLDAKSVKAYNVLLSDVKCRIFFGGTGRELAAGLEACGLEVWDGKINANVIAQLEPKVPTYHFGVSVDRMQLAKAVESQFSLFKNTVLGKASFNVNGSGASFNSKTAMSRLDAKGSMRVNQPKFASIDVMQMVTKAINEAIAKVPAVAGKQLAAPRSQEARYESMSGDFTIAGGKFDAPNFYAKPEANQGFDIKGRTSLGLIDQKIDADWDVIDTFNLTHASDLKQDVLGAGPVAILSEGGAPVRLPIRVGGTVSSPSYAYDRVVAHFGKVVAENVAKAGQKRIQQEVQKKAGDALKKLFGR